MEPFEWGNPLLANGHEMEPVKKVTTNTMRNKLSIAFSVVKSGSMLPGDASTVKEKFANAGSAVKQRVGNVKRRVDVFLSGKVAASECMEPLLTSDLSDEGVADALYEANTEDTNDPAAALHNKQQTQAKIIDPAVVELLLEMGFPKTDVDKVLKKAGTTSNVQKIIHTLCRMDERRSAPRVRDESMHRFAEALTEIARNAESNAQESSMLCKVQAEVYAQLATCMQLSSEVPVQTLRPMHLKPSVGTWLMPLHMTRDPSVTIPSEISPERPDAVDDALKPAEACSCISSRRGAVCCGA